MARSVVLAIDAVLILLFFIGMPAIAAVIALAARKGFPRNFSREMYWTAMVVAGAIAATLGVVAQRDSCPGLWHAILRYVCMAACLMLLGVGMGCAAAVFAYHGPTFSRLSQPK